MEEKGADTNWRHGLAVRQQIQSGLKAMNDDSDLDSVPTRTALAVLSVALGALAFYVGALAYLASMILSL